MTHIALLRGINVGNSVKINMKELKELFEELGCENVSTYINSGNVFFDSIETKQNICNVIEDKLFHKTNSEIRVLIKTKSEVVKIANSIPGNWENNKIQKTDVAYLFENIDNDSIIEQFHIKLEYIKIMYVQGAIIWNVQREDYNKSQLNKLISQKIYKDMTVRNVNTARYIASFNMKKIT